MAEESRLADCTAFPVEAVSITGLSVLWPDLVWPYLEAHGHADTVRTRGVCAGRLGCVSGMRGVRRCGGRAYRGGRCESQVFRFVVCLLGWTSVVNRDAAQGNGSLFRSVDSSGRVFVVATLILQPLTTRTAW